ncbi:MAG: tetratricopeptide repeat protein [Hyphomonadaceae bacterium]
MNDLLNSFLGLLPQIKLGDTDFTLPVWGFGSLAIAGGLIWKVIRSGIGTAADIKTLNAKPAATPQDVQDAADDIKAVVDDGAVKQDAKQEEILKHLVEMKEQKAAEAGRVLDEQAKQTFIEQVRKVLQSTDAKKGPAREALSDNRPLDAAGELMKVAQQEGAMADDVSRAAKEAGSTAAETFREAGGIYYSDRPDLALNAYREAARLDTSHFGSLICLSRLEHKQGGDVVAAKTAAEQALQAAGDERERSVALNDLGEISMQAGDTDAALGLFTEDLEIARALAEANPGSSEAKRDVSVSLNKLGDVAMQAGDTDAALGYFTDSSDILGALSEANPGSAEAKRDVIVSLAKLGGMTSEVSYWQQALVIAEEMEAKGQLAPVDAGMVEQIRKQIAAAGE